jgi:lipopolysaccharide export system ATP-binding protein
VSAGPGDGTGSSPRGPGLRKSYGSRTVVDGVRLAVKSGEVVGLLGPNGAGKTTSFYMIVGLVRADGGEITIEGRRVERMPIHQRSRLGLSYLPQEPSIFRKLNVEQNIRAVLELQVGPDGRPLKKPAIDEMLEGCCATCRSRSCGPRRRRRSPAASGAGSRSPGRWRRSRASSCSTSRSPASTRSP